MAGRAIAIGDTHGCLQTLIHLLYEVIKITKEDHLYFLGDYVDRGPDSKGIIDKVIALKQEGFKVTALKGNHEEILKNTVHDSLLLNNWLRFGGTECLKSFGVNHPSEIPRQYFDFIDNLELYVETEDAFLVHGGFDFTKVNPFEDWESMLWLRSMEIDPFVTKGKPVIHGHTPVTLSETQRQLKEGSLNICIDTGCVFDHKNGEKMGILTAIDLKTKKLYYCENREY